MEIQQFEEQDRAAVIALWKECGLVAPHNNPSKDIDRKLAVNPELFLVGMVEGNLVATVMGGYEGHRGWINYLAVKSSTQLKGYGLMMMQAVEGLIKAKGCPKINLQIRSSNKSVIAFYDSIGYVADPVVSYGKRLSVD